MVFFMFIEAKQEHACQFQAKQKKGSVYITLRFTQGPQLHVLNRNNRDVFHSSEQFLSPGEKKQST